MSTSVQITPTDAFRVRVFMAPVAMMVSVVNGWVQESMLDLGSRQIRLVIRQHDLTEGVDDKVRPLTSPLASQTARLYVEVTAEKGTLTSARSDQVRITQCSAHQCGDGAGAVVGVGAGRAGRAGLDKKMQGSKGYEPAQSCDTKRNNTVCGVVSLGEAGMVHVVVGW